MGRTVFSPSVLVEGVFDFADLFASSVCALVPFVRNDALTHVERIL